MALFKGKKKKRAEKAISAGFHEINIQSVTRLTEDCVQISLDIPNLLREKFHFIPGQYLDFSVFVEKADHSR